MPSLPGRTVGVVLLLTPVCARAGEHLIGHRTSTSSYSGDEGRFKLKASAGSDGNASTFVLPILGSFETPATAMSYVLIKRDGGVLYDALTWGTWKGYGNPRGSKGWKYLNPHAPLGGPISLLQIKPRSIRIGAKDTGGLPVPGATNGSIHTVIQIGDERYCAEARAPHAKEIAARLIKSTDQAPATACQIECELGDDSDVDRLIDCVETATGIFAGAQDTGTDPSDDDTDDDGLQDGDEVLVTDSGLDLAALGVNPLRKDVLVEYDWLEDELDCGAHSHRPALATLHLLAAMFAAAPVDNPDSSTGVNLIQDIGQGAPFDGGNAITGVNAVVDTGDWIELEDAHFTANRVGYFHHGLVPHARFGTTSNGAATIVGYDFLAVAEGCQSDPLGGAMVVAHELGHNLGLLHGGGDGCNHKPNYNSVMNYEYSSGIAADCTPIGAGVLGYSLGDRLELDENNLNENEGVCGAPAWDWNGNLLFESAVSLDLNPEVAPEIQALPGNCAGTLTVLRDHDDWGNLNYEGPRRYLPPHELQVRSLSLQSETTIDCALPLP